MKDLRDYLIFPFAVMFEFFDFIVPVLAVVSLCAAFLAGLIIGSLR